MDTQTTSNHHATRGKKKPSAKPANKTLRAAAKVQPGDAGGVSGLVHEGQAQLERLTHGATGFVRRNPKTSVGVALGAGLLIGALIDGRLASMAAGSIHGLVKLARKRLR